MAARHTAPRAPHNCWLVEAARDNVILTVAASTVESYFWLSAYTWQEEIAQDVLKNREASRSISLSRSSIAADSSKSSPNFSFAVQSKS